MSICCIGLGGNRGRVAETFAAALREMRTRGVEVRDVSRLYRTRPMGAASAPFLNACVTAETELPPEELLAVLKQTEAAAGREPAERWSARELDLDVLLIDEQVIRTPILTVPHPGLVYRRFVLDPLHDVAPGFLVPHTMRTVAELRKRLLRRPMPIALAGGLAEDRERIATVVRQRFPTVHVAPQRAEWTRDVDATVFVLDAGTDDPAVNRGGVSVSVERGLGSMETAVCAMVEAMLDEPQDAGELIRP
jgi:2-amino-4-hydroxy-6-hydroxymethyldihydropteridine diphosphokinase